MIRKNLMRILFGFPAFCVAAGLVAFVPAIFYVEERRGYLAATGTVPNLDPGVVLSLQLVLAVPLVLLAIVCEVLRIWGFRGSPLSALASMLFGALSTLPTVSVFFPAIPSSFALHFLYFVVLVGGFYMARHFYLHNRGVNHAP